MYIQGGVGMVDFDAQFFLDLFVLLFALIILTAFISILVLLIIFLVKAIKNQNMQSEIYKNAQKQEVD